MGELLSRSTLDGKHERGCPLFTHPSQRRPDHPTECTCPPALPAESFIIEYIPEEQWLVATDPEGASAVIATDVNPKFVGRLIGQVTPATTPIAVEMLADPRFHGVGCVTTDYGCTCGMAENLAMVEAEAARAQSPIADAGVCPTCGSTRCVGRLQYEDCDQRGASPLGPTIERTREAEVKLILNAVPHRNLDDDGDGYGGVPFIPLDSAILALTRDREDMLRRALSNIDDALVVTVPREHVGVKAATGLPAPLPQVLRVCAQCEHLGFSHENDGECVECGCPGFAS